MRKAYKYRLYPTKEQARLLDGTLELCRYLYNCGLEQRIRAYKQAGVQVSAYEQINELPEIKDNFPEYKEIHSQVLQDVLRRLDKAFQSFLRRAKEGKEKPGFPRYKGQGRYDSFTYPQPREKHLPDGGRVHLPKIGVVKIKYHRALTGKAKTITVTRQNDKYYACFSCEAEAAPLPKTNKAVGIDVGVIALVATSDGERIEAPKTYRKAEKRLKYLQREVSRRKKGSYRRKKSVRKLARAHEKVGNQRRDMAHKAARHLVNNYDLIIHEDLRVKNMVKNHRLAKSIQDAGWNLFFTILAGKAAEAGRQIVKVPPAYTSQACSNCGEVVKKSLSVRVHRCPACGLILDRDVNAARNILALTG